MSVLFFRRALSAIALSILSISSMQAQKSGVVTKPAVLVMPQVCDPARFIGKAYQDLLQRPIDTAGSNYWLALMKNGLSRTQVATQLMRSTEFTTARVRALYSAYLHRPAASSETAALSSMSIEQIRSTILGSNEYFTSRGGGTPQGFVAALYQDVLGRAADPQAVTLFTQQLRGGATLASIAQHVVTSAEAQLRQMNALYLRYLHRAAAGPMPPGGEDLLVASIIGSDEYCRR